jgi:hypothetical protein
VLIIVIESEAKDLIVGLRFFAGLPRKDSSE